MRWYEIKVEIYNRSKKGFLECRKLYDLSVIDLICVIFVEKQLY